MSEIGFKAKLLKRSYVEQELAWLKNYLTKPDDKKGEELAGEFPREFQSWAKKNPNYGVDLSIFEGEEWYMDDTILSRIPRKALAKFSREFFTDDPAAPLYTMASFERVIKNSWLVHFTDHAAAVAREGFTKGVALYEWEKLGLSTNFGSRGKKSGFNFAYTFQQADYRKGKKYGKEAVVFRASGIEISHYGDNEDQVIFIGATATDIVPIFEDYGEFLVSVGERELRFDTFNSALSWVVDNYAQYGNQLLPSRGRKRKLPGKRFLETPR